MSKNRMGDSHEFLFTYYALFFGLRNQGASRGFADLTLTLWPRFSWFSWF